MNTEYQRGVLKCVCEWVRKRERAREREREWQKARERYKIEVLFWEYGPSYNVTDDTALLPTGITHYRQIVPWQ